MSTTWSGESEANPHKPVTHSPSRLPKFSRVLLAKRNAKQNANRREVAYPAPGALADDPDDAARAIVDSSDGTRS